jgi:hypothetical protein
LLGQADGSGMRVAHALDECRSLQREPWRGGVRRAPSSISSHARVTGEGAA